MIGNLIRWVVINILKSIYKITNLINGKVYIGQSKNPEKRFLEHIYGKNNYKSIIHMAINKYGIDNFSFEIIEHMTENYNEREKYWISYYKSNDKIFGYNITDGGENPPIITGESNSFCKYTDEVVFKIQKDLFDNIISFQEIVNKYNISNEYLTLLNRGKIRYNEKYIYPIRKNGNERISENLVFFIIHELNYTDKSIEQISKENEVSSKVIHIINKGNHFYSPKNIDYPIRLKGYKYSNSFINALVKELKENKYQFSQIETMYNISHSVLSRFNNGKTCYLDGINYPIRPSTKRVYEPVETIPS